MQLARFPLQRMDQLQQVPMVQVRTNRAVNVDFGQTFSYSESYSDSVSIICHTGLILLFVSI